MKFVRVLPRLALLLLVVAAFVGLTRIYGSLVTYPLPDPGWRAWRQHRPSAPQVGRFPELLGEGMVFAIYAVAGRIVLRLRLSPASRSEGHLILLGLHKEGLPNHARSGSRSAKFSHRSLS